MSEDHGLTQERMLRIKDSMEVEDPAGHQVEIEPGQDDLLILAVTACIDQMAH